LKTKPITYRLQHHSTYATGGEHFPKPRATCHKLYALFPSATCYVLYAAFFLMVGCSTVEPQQYQDVVLAYVNGEPVTVQLVEAAFNESHQGHSAFLAGQGAVRELLEKVIDKQLLLQEAKRVEMDRDPQVDHSVERLRAARATEKFFRDKVTDQATISDEAIAEAYKRVGDRFQARHILVASREAAEKALNRVKAGADFGEVAVEVSQAKTAAKGGYLGVIRFGQLEPELEEKLWPLQTGQVSEPFETSEGWNLLYVVERKSAEELPPLEKVRTQLKGILTKRETARLQDQLYRELKKRWNPQVDEANLLAIATARNKAELASDAPVVTIGDDKITIGQVLARIDFETMQKLADPIAVRAVSNMLDADILGILIRKEALAQGYGKKPEIEKEAEVLRDKMAMELLLDRVTFAKLEASDDDAKTYWQNHADRFTEPATVKLSLIFVTSENDAQKLLTDLRGGADFAVMARKTSEHRPSADLGGDLGWVNKGRLQPEIEKVAFSLNAGEVGMAQMEAGTMVIRVEEKKQARIKPFAEAKDQAKELALQEKARATLKVWVTKLREASVIEIDDGAINRAAAAYEEKVRQKAEPKHG
jgi:peptidyl-prolyl cis-trans isomerase C